MSEEEQVVKSIPEIPDQETTKAKIDLLLWDSVSTRIVGNFVRGKSVQLASRKERKNLWQQVKASTDFEEGEHEILLEKVYEIHNTLSDTGLIEGTKEKTQKEKPSSDEYAYSVRQRAKVLQDIVPAALRKFSIWGPNESRRTVAYGGFRKGKKSGFSESEILGAKVSKKGFVSHAEGGPQIMSSVYAPKHESTKNPSDDRVRRSLAHEIQHVLRAFSNRNLWEGHEAEAEQTGLRKPSTEVKRKFIGGYYVGSNMQGSEAIGELFAVVVKQKANTVSEPTIKEVLPDLAERLKVSAEKYKKRFEEYKAKKRDKAPTSRYLAAKLALVDHLLKLEDMGYGDLKAIDLVALGTYGYVSLEKVPVLIELGILSKEKYQRMRQVVRNVSNWLTSPNESGFRLKTQNI